MKRLVALAAMAALLAAMGWLNLRWLEKPVSLSPIVSPNASPALDLDAPAEADGSGPGKPHEITETLLRPLFHANRRPFVPPAVAVAAAPVVDEEANPSPQAEVDETPPETRPDLRLAGVSISGGNRRALLGPAEGTEVRWYTQGDDLGGWIVASITSQTVTLASGDRSFTVPLYPSSGAGSGEP